MKIKKDRQLKPGDTLTWDVSIHTSIASFNENNIPVVVEKIYTHHVDVRELKPPHQVFNIQNVDLWNKGIYKTIDIDEDFANDRTSTI